MSLLLAQNSNESVNPADSSTEQALFKDASVEFLACLLPSYAFVLLASWRFYSIKHLGHSPEQPDLYPLKVIKYVSFAMMFTYAFNWVVSYIDHTAVNLSKQEINFAICYIFPVIAWYWSFELTNAELKRKLEPEPTNQFLFWILSTIFVAIKIFFEPKYGEITLLVDVPQLLLSLFLTIYFHKNETLIFDYVDDDKEKVILDKNLLDTRRLQSIKIDDEEMEDMETSREKLAKVDVKMPRKYQRRMSAFNTYDKFFEIKVSINKGTPHKVTHSLPEFINLAKELRMIYTLSKFKVLSTSPPSLDFETLQRLNLSDDITDTTTMIEELEKFLSTLCADPILMHEIVLDFLGIPNPHRARYIKFISFAQMMNSRFSPIVKRGSQAGRISFEMNEMSQSGRKSVNRRVPLELHVKKLEFDSSKSSTKGVKYKFEITMIKNHEAPVVWIISKQYKDFRVTYQKMKQELVIEPPKVEEFIPRPLSITGGDDNQKYYQKMLDGLERYLKTIFSIKKLYCASLLEFLGLNPVDLELVNQVESDNSQEGGLLMV